MLARRARLLIGFACATLALSTALSACSSSVVITQCQGDTASCDGDCVDLSSDPDNCGDCGNVCPGLCSGGECTTSGCIAPQVECNGSCVDTQSDPFNCGGCGTVCDSFCSFGNCSDQCAPGLSNCNGFCVDTKSDPQNCGGCNIPCGFDQQCFGGFCEGAQCDPPFESCFDGCVDIQSDPFNCGGCGIVCDQGSFCQNFECSVSPCDENTCGICEVAFLPSDAPFTVTGNTTMTSNFFVPPCTQTQANEVLHVFTAPSDAVYTFNTVGSQYDTVLSFLDPESCGVIDCNDDSIDLDAQLSTFMSAGQSLFVVVDGFSDGLYQLNVSSGTQQCPDGLTECDNQCVDTLFDNDHCGGCFQPCSGTEFCDFGNCEPICNDECGACSIIDLASSVPQTIQGSTAGATDTLFPSCALGSSPEAVHRFFAPNAGTFVFSTANSGYDTVLSVIDPQSCGDIACNDNFGAQLSSRVTVTLAAGQEVLVLVDGNGGSGTYSLSITGSAQPACPTMALGNTLPISISGSTVGAANAYVPSCSGSNAPEHTFTFTAPTTKTYSFDTFGSNYDSVLSVLNGQCQGPSLACNDDANGLQSQVSVPLTAGQTVTVIVDGFGGQSGSYQLHIF